VWITSAIRFADIKRQRKMLFEILPEIPGLPLRFPGEFGDGMDVPVRTDVFDAGSVLFKLFIAKRLLEPFMYILY
jgi:hypothetical protein